LSAVTCGIPYVLAVSAGIPWPSQATSLGDLALRLTQPVSDAFVTKLLALAGWTCWTAFMTTLGREAVWTARRFRTLLGDTTALRSHLRSVPPHRMAAVFLISILLFALAAMWRPSTGQTVVDASVAARPAAYVSTLAEPQQQAAETPTTVPYTVAPGDALWDIARDRLGDPLRWPEIYRLNCDRTQADGHRLRDPDLIHPGWILHLPTHPDVKTTNGEPVHPAPTKTSAPEHGRPSPAHQHLAQAPRTSIAVPHNEATAEPRTAHHPNADAPSHPERHRAVGIGVGTASTIGITTAVGIATALRFSRAHARRHREPDLASAAPPPLAQAVRVANTAHLTVRQPEEEAADRSDTLLTRQPGAPEPMAPGTVVCAVEDGHELTVDALAVPGGVALTGPGAEPAARALAIAVLSTAERLRPGPPKVRLLTPSGTAERLLPHPTQSLPAWTTTRDGSQALSLIEQSLLHRARLAAGHDTSVAPAIDEPPMDLLITDTHQQSVEHLKATAQRAAPGQLAIVVLQTDDWPAQARLDTDGAVLSTAGLISLGAGRLFTLAPEPAHELLDVLYAAHGRTTPATPKPPPPPPPPPPSVPPPVHRPPAAQQPDPKPSSTHTHQQPVDREDGQGTIAEAPEEKRPSAPVTVHVLGRFRIRARGKNEEFGHGMRPETREFLCLLAAHPNGIRSEEITEALRITSDPEQAGRELANLRRAVRRSLRQATGAQQAAFVVRVGDRHLLDKNLINTDIAAFTAAVQQASLAREERVRAAALKAAIAAYAGPFCEGADYPWADEMREAVHRKAVDALVLLADHTAKSQPDSDEVLGLLDQAAEWDPYNEAVYQRIIRLQRSLGRDDAAHRTYALLKRRLADLDAVPDPATSALLQKRQPASAR
jgi:DNA-binding SARP family transcriptional activator